jgi:hypothetical protein
VSHLPTIPELVSESDVKVLGQIYGNKSLEVSSLRVGSLAALFRAQLDTLAFQIPQRIRTDYGMLAEQGDLRSRSIQSSLDTNAINQIELFGVSSFAE